MTRLRSDAPEAARNSGSLDQPKRQGGRGANRPETDETPGTVTSPAEVATATIAATDAAPIAALLHSTAYRKVRCEARSARPPSAADSPGKAKGSLTAEGPGRERRRPQARDEPTGPRLTTQQHPANDRTNQHSTLRSTTSHHTHGIPLLQTACGRSPFRRFGLRSTLGFDRLRPARRRTIIGLGGRRWHRHFRIRIHPLHKRRGCTGFRAGDRR